MIPSTNAVYPTVIPSKAWLLKLLLVLACHGVIVMVLVPCHLPQPPLHDASCSCITLLWCGASYFSPSPGPSASTSSALKPLCIPSIYTAVGMKILYWKLKSVCFYVRLTWLKFWPVLLSMFIVLVYPQVSG